MRGFKNFLKAAAVVAPMAFGGMAANATVIDTAAGGTNGNVLSFSWSKTLANGVILQGTGTMTATLENGNLVLAVSLSNNATLLNVGDNNALVSFGFGIDPNATGVTLTNTVDNGAAGTNGDMNDAVKSTQQGSTQIPSLDNIEICAFGVTSGNCSGGDVNEGVQAGQNDQFKLTLAGTWGATVDIAPIGFKYQGTYGSYEFYTTSTTTTSGPSNGSGNVPEPASSTLVGLGLGLLGMGFVRRRKNAA